MADGEALGGIDAALGARLAFVREIDALKRVDRRSFILGASRRENSAEHSWHLAMMAIVLAPHASEPVDVARVVQMLLVHDIVEIDAGDTFAYDDDAHADKDEREQAAADRLFALLPAEQARSIRASWDEFEAGVTPEARFARALDRLQPLLLNHGTEGRMWQEHGITADRVLAYNGRIADGSGDLWAVARALVADATARGWLGQPSSGADSGISMSG